MKKLIFGGLLLASIGVGVVGCKKEKINLNNSNNSSTKSNNFNVPFTIKEGVLLFDTWEDVNRLEDAFEKSIDDQIAQFEVDYANVLRTLRVPVAGSSSNDPNGIELTWESELAVDSFEMAIGWSQYQSLIDFENENNFKSLRSIHYDLLYGDAESDQPSKLSDEQRVYLLTFPIGYAMATMFNEKALIGVGDSLYKVLGNNVWISSTFDNKSIIENLNESNYQTVIGRNGIKVYDVDNEKSTGCYANKKKHWDKTSSNNNYRIYGMSTVTNVAVINGRYIKGRTQAEIRNNKGKWKSRRTYCQVSGGAPLRLGWSCWEVNDLGGPYVPQNIVNGVFNESHHNRSERIGRFYCASVFRIKSNTFLSYHKAGTGSNALEFSMLLD